MTNIKAILRNETTSSANNKLRKNGFIPAILYGGKDPNKKISMWALNMKDEKKYFKAFRCAMYLEKIDKFFNKQKKEYKKKQGRNV